MNEGTNIFFNETKDFGFISPSNGGANLFVHTTGLNAQVSENDEVSYEVSEGNRPSTIESIKAEITQKTIKITKNHNGNSNVIINKQVGKFHEERTYLGSSDFFCRQ